MKKENIGSSFDDFLREDGMYEEVTATAIKQVLARQIAAQMDGAESEQSSHGKAHAHKPRGA